MSEKHKAIASIQVFANEFNDDYSIEGYVRVGGVKLEIDTNMNRIRDFFTKRSVKNSSQRKLAYEPKAVLTKPS